MECPNCKFQHNPKNSIYCGGCGIKLIKKCKTCGFGYSSLASRYCGICGNPFNDDWRQTAEFKSDINNPSHRKVTYCTHCGHHFQRYDENICAICGNDRQTFIPL